MTSVQTGAFKISKNRSALPISVVAAITNVQVQDEINQPAMFSFNLNLNGTNSQGQSNTPDVFSTGDEVTIFLGLDQLHQVIIGDITAVEPHFSTNGSSATIRGFDRMYRLKFGKWSKAYTNVNDNEIASQVAKSSGLNVSLRGNPPLLESYVLQNNQSNFDFLLQRAGYLDYELLMDQTTLVYRPSAEGESPLKTLQFPRDFEDVNLNLRLPTKGKSVTAIGYDVATNKVLYATAASATPQDKMGGSETGYQAADDFPDSDIVLQCPNVSDPRALQAIANAQFQADLQSFIEGDVSLIGDNTLKAGVNLKLTGMSDKFDGIYYVTSSTHSYDDSTGYKTSIKVRRSGI